MAVTVSIPTQLRPVTGGDAEAEVSGETVGEVLDSLFDRYTGVMFVSDVAVSRVEYFSPRSAPQ